MKYLIFIFFVSFFLSLQAQDKSTISGKILDAELYNEPLLMASIALNGTAWYTQTNFNGNFQITDIDAGSYTMKISFLGYEDVEVELIIDKNSTLFVQHSLRAKTMILKDVADISSASRD
ncbi:carboxypeptidase-like regulatory domain-containing protein [Maribacter antarcticus]|uniref:carboxypeptidase-like regulatory domain-containing protein n=1 Tax=Maribacter antarcticus TaxID=505250 RepID=UPI00047ECF84|nr:carboxypeptidase-like regulatory domain-containing protein [Maribacter antarcticus]